MADSLWKLCSIKYFLQLIFWIMDSSCSTQDNCITFKSSKPRCSLLLGNLLSADWSPGISCLGWLLFISEEQLQMSRSDWAHLLWWLFLSWTTSVLINRLISSNSHFCNLSSCEVWLSYHAPVCVYLYLYEMNFCALINWSLFLAGVWGSHSILWALLRGEPVRESALTAWSARFWSGFWWDQKCLQQQEHLSTLPLALFPVFQELSHISLPVLHLWTTCSAHWKVSTYFANSCSLLKSVFHSGSDIHIVFLLTGTSLTSCKLCHSPPLRGRASSCRWV